MAAETNEVIEQEPAAKTTRAKKGSDALSGKKVKLTIHKDSNPSAVDPVFVGVNFVGYSIKRGEEVVVPTEIAEALHQATEIRYEQQGSELVMREVPSYAITVMPV